MILSVLRQATCIIICMLLYIACNQSRHLVNDHAAKADREYVLDRDLKIEKLFTTANSLIGKPYGLGSSGPKSFDCSGFTTHIFQSIHLSLPRMASQQARIGNPVKLPMVQPGDLLFFGGKNIDHVAMVTKVKADKVFIIHATSKSGVVKEVFQDSEYWVKRFKLARRVII
ncbi:MAG: C40 family peptidase [Saprospiraceae bacterium]